MDLYYMCGGGGGGGESAVARSRGIAKTRCGSKYCAKKHIFFVRKYIYLLFVLPKSIERHRYKKKQYEQY